MGCPVSMQLLMRCRRMDLKPYITAISRSQQSDDFASLKHPMLKYISTNCNLPYQSHHVSHPTLAVLHVSLLVISWLKNLLTKQVVLVSQMWMLLCLVGVKRLPSHTDFNAVTHCITFNLCPCCILLLHSRLHLRLQCLALDVSCMISSHP
ncbi:uncharacterized protein F5147DRAFT_683576 [Suillus discolor]|uniref:Uncharacterized protein n=1 Tax=Suillus discolor TaxID=1912936 RepID=A0A9P7FB06_9AGAM|nr:uncharacterized protein F5147DRAFT_683576 [Suillus discolor]KAG2112586.1 hypothetical protein F5147DRAFT_683576 [Suillus discolor]